MSDYHDLERRVEALRQEREAYIRAHTPTPLTPLQIKAQQSAEQAARERLQERASQQIQDVLRFLTSHNVPTAIFVTGQKVPAKRLKSSIISKILGSEPTYEPSTYRQIEIGRGWRISSESTEASEVDSSFQTTYFGLDTQGQLYGVNDGYVKATRPTDIQFDKYYIARKIEDPAEQVRILSSENTLQRLAVLSTLGH